MATKEERGRDPGGGDAVYQGGGDAARGAAGEMGDQVIRAGQYGGWRDGGIVGLQPTSAEQQELDVGAAAPAQRASDLQQQLLGAGGESVVADQQQRAGTGAGRGNGAGSRVQPGPAVMQIRLEVGAFGPFVPSVHTDQPLAHERVRGGALDQGGEPGLVGGGGAAVQQQAFALAARVIVPARDGGLDQRKGRRRLGQRGGDHIAVVVDLRGGGLVEPSQRRIARLQPGDQLVRRELDRAVETVQARIVGAEALRHHQHGVFAAAVAEGIAPAS